MTYAAPQVTYAAPAAPAVTYAAPVQGNTNQTVHPTTTMRGEATGHTEHHPNFSSVREAGAPVYHANLPPVEIEQAPIIGVQRSEQTVAGEVRQNVVEIPTVSE